MWAGRTDDVKGLEALREGLALGVRRVRVLIRPKGVAEDGDLELGAIQRREDGLRDILVVVQHRDLVRGHCVCPFREMTFKVVSSSLVVIVRRKSEGPGVFVRMRARYKLKLVAAVPESRCKWGRIGEVGRAAPHHLLTPLSSSFPTGAVAHRSTDTGATGTLRTKKQQYTHIITSRQLHNAPTSYSATSSRRQSATHSHSTLNSQQRASQTPQTPPDPPLSSGTR